MTWKQLYRHFEEHEFESGINFRQMERFIMNNKGRISGKATWVLVVLYHDASTHFSLKKYFTNKILILQRNYSNHIYIYKLLFIRIL